MAQHDKRQEVDGCHGVLVKKSEAKSLVKSLCHDWRKDTDLDNHKTEDLRSSDFLSWLKTHHPDCLKFRSTMSPVIDIELWFDQEFNQIWRR